MEYSAIIKIKVTKANASFVNQSPRIGAAVDTVIKTREARRLLKKLQRKPKMRQGARVRLNSH